MFGLWNFSPYIDKVQILMIFPNIRPPVVEKLRSQNEDLWQLGRQRRVVYKSRKRSVQVDIFRRHMALQMCCSYVGEEKCTSELFCAPLPPAENIVPRWNLQFRSRGQSTTKPSSLVSLCYFVAEILRVKLWKKRQKSQNWQSLGTYLAFGKEIAKIRRENVSNFTLEQYALCAIYLTIPHFLKLFVKDDDRPKNWKMWLAPWDPLLGIGPRNFAEIWRPLTSNSGKKIGTRYPKLGGDIRGATNFFTPKFLKN